MIQNLNISIVQTSLHWHDKDANLAGIDNIVKGISTETDIIVLPEMFTTGFTMHVPAQASAFHDDMDALAAMRKWARITGAVVTGSVAVSDHGKCYNRLLWVRPDGSVGTYDKRHLFRMAGENNHYTAGTRKIVEEWKGWRICPLICYDLRFPVWSRNRWMGNHHEYDVLIYVANWPSVRRHPWRALLTARAMENQCYLAGVNRTGTDGNGHEYSGDSMILSPRGEILADPLDKEGVFQASLSWEELADFRLKFPVIDDADDFELK
ncbi:MAG: hypothetical protein RL220_1371 [Bacteroidota bacterium]